MRSACLALVCAGLATPAFAQCTLAYQAPSFTPLQGITAMGRRPMGQLLVMGPGTFAERNVNGWVSMTPGFTSANDLAAATNGDVVVTGFHFTSQLVCTYHPYFGTSCNYVPVILSLGIHLANGSWTYPNASSAQWAETMANGTVVYYASGWYSIGSAPGLSTLNKVPLRAAAHPEGGLVVLADDELHRYDNGFWTTLGPAAFDVPPNKLRMTSDGALLALGDFSSINSQPIDSLAKFDGAGWQSLGSVPGGRVFDVAELPNGDLVAAGSFTSIQGVAANRIARWDGSTWSPIGSGTDDTIHALQWADGSLWLGGDFTFADGLASPYLARLVSTCPAAAVMTGAGCSGTNGLDMLEPMEFPWLNGTYVSHASGLPTSAFAVSVYGLAPAALPLASALPQALAGCDLQVAPVLSNLGLVTDGTYDDALLLNGPTLFVGQTLYHQVIAAGLDLNGSIFEITSTNALELAIGDF